MGTLQGYGGVGTAILAVLLACLRRLEGR
jgi:hypothetical protein